VFDLLALFRFDAVFPAPPDATLDQHAQPAVRIVALGHQLARVGVLQLFQGEVAALGDAQGLGQQFAISSTSGARKYCSTCSSAMAASAPH